MSKLNGDPDLIKPDLSFVVVADARIELMTAYHRSS